MSSGYHAAECACGAFAGLVFVCARDVLVESVERYGRIGAGGLQDLQRRKPDRHERHQQLHRQQRQRHHELQLSGLGLRQRDTPQRVGAVDAAFGDDARHDTSDRTNPHGNGIAYNRVDLSWTPSTDSGGSGLNFYWIYRNGSYLWDTSLSGPITSYSDLTTGKHNVHLHGGSAGSRDSPQRIARLERPDRDNAIGAAGAAAWRARLDQRVGRVRGPAGCQDLYSSFTLNWAVTSGGTPDRYELQRSTNGGGAWRSLTAER